MLKLVSRCCYSPVCRATCYWTHKGFDYGYCDNGSCKCDSPAVYVFDGVGRDLSDVEIKNSLNNNNVIQRTVKSYLFIVLCFFFNII